MRKIIFPYPTLAADVELNISNVQLDGKDINTDFVLTGDRLMDLSLIHI